MSEWFKEHAWKACVLETVPWVRIPPSPLDIDINIDDEKHNKRLRMVREPDSRDL